MELSLKLLMTQVMNCQKMVSHRAILWLEVHGFDKDISKLKKMVLIKMDGLILEIFLSLMKTAT